MSLQQTIEQDLKTAMRAGDAARRDALRLALSSIRNARIAQGSDLDDAAIQAVLMREVKQRRDSIEEFRKGGRDDLAAREETEAGILSGYLPEPAGQDEIRQRAEVIIAETGASGPRDMGKVMPKLMAELRGRADGKEISGVVQELLARG